MLAPTIIDNTAAIDDILFFLNLDMKLAIQNNQLSVKRLYDRIVSRLQVHDLSFNIILTDDNVRKRLARFIGIEDLIVHHNNLAKEAAAQALSLKKLSLETNSDLSVEKLFNICYGDTISGKKILEAESQLSEVKKSLRALSKTEEKEEREEKNDPSLDTRVTKPVNQKASERKLLEKREIWLTKRISLLRYDAMSRLVGFVFLKKLMQLAQAGELKLSYFGKDNKEIAEHLKNQLSCIIRPSQECPELSFVIVENKIGYRVLVELGSLTGVDVTAKSIINLKDYQATRNWFQPIARSVQETLLKHEQFINLGKAQRADKHAFGSNTADFFNLEMQNEIPRQHGPVLIMTTPHELGWLSIPMTTQYEILINGFTQDKTQSSQFWQSKNTSVEDEPQNMKVKRIMENLSQKINDYLSRRPGRNVYTSAAEIIKEKLSEALLKNRYNDSDAVVSLFSFIQANLSGIQKHSGKQSSLVPMLENSLKELNMSFPEIISKSKSDTSLPKVMTLFP